MKKQLKWILGMFIFGLGISNTYAINSTLSPTEQSSGYYTKISNTTQLVGGPHMYQVKRFGNDLYYIEDDGQKRKLHMVKDYLIPLGQTDKTYTIGTNLVPFYLQNASDGSIVGLLTNTDSKKYAVVKGDNDNNTSSIDDENYFIVDLSNNNCGNTNDCSMPISIYSPGYTTNMYSYLDYIMGYDGTLLKVQVDFNAGSYTVGLYKGTVPSGFPFDHNYPVSGTSNYKSMGWNGITWEFISATPFYNPSDMGNSLNANGGTDQNPLVQQWNSMYSNNVFEIGNNGEYGLDSNGFNNVLIRTTDIGTNGWTNNRVGNLSKMDNPPPSAWGRFGQRVVKNYDGSGNYGLFYNGNYREIGTKPYIDGITGNSMFETVGVYGSDGNNYYIGFGKDPIMCGMMMCGTPQTIILTKFNVSDGTFVKLDSFDGKITGWGQGHNVFMGSDGMYAFNFMYPGIWTGSGETTPSSGTGTTNTGTTNTGTIFSFTNELPDFTNWCSNSLGDYLVCPYKGFISLNPDEFPSSTPIDRIDRTEIYGTDTSFMSVNMNSKWKQYPDGNLNTEANNVLNPSTLSGIVTIYVYQSYPGSGNPYDAQFGQTNPGQDIIVRKSYTINTGISPTGGSGSGTTNVGSGMEFEYDVTGNTDTNDLNSRYSNLRDNYESKTKLNDNVIVDLFLNLMKSEKQSVKERLLEGQN